MSQSCVYDKREELFNRGCEPDGADFIELQDISYIEDVQPIFQLHCQDCHIDESFGGIMLGEYQSVKFLADEGLLACVINHGDNCYAMPPDLPKIDQCEILIIETWINEGALEN